jgi:hypothetical protein
MNGSIARSVKDVVAATLELGPVSLSEGEVIEFMVFYFSWLSHFPTTHAPKQLQSRTEAQQIAWSYFMGRFKLHSDTNK